MKTPLVLSADDGIYVFQSEDDLIRDIEAIDVANGEYVAYDSEGRLLLLSVERSKGILGALRGSKVVLGQTSEFRNEELRGLLIAHLERLVSQPKELGSLVLDQLLRRVVERES